MQTLCRAVLGVLVCYSFIKFQSAIHKMINPNIAKVGIILTIIQFHFMFYTSRTLPNTFALILVLHAMAAWLMNENYMFILYSGIAILVFRFELCILLGLLMLVKLYERKLSLTFVICHCAVLAPIIIGTSVIID